MDSLIGPIPDSWRYQRIDDYCEVNAGPGGSMLKREDKVVSGVPIVNVGDIDDGRIKGTPAIAVSQRAAERLDVYRLAVDDIQLIRIRSTTKHALVAPAQAGWLMGSSSIRIRIPAGSRWDISPKYLSCYLRHPAVQEFLTQLTHQGVLPNLTVATVAKLPLVLPPLETQLAIVEVAWAAEDKIQVHENIARTTQQLRDVLLPQMLSGVVAAGPVQWLPTP
jgi:restriction endonuclease S subunit